MNIKTIGKKSMINSLNYNFLNYYIIFIDEYQGI